MENVNAERKAPTGMRAFTIVWIGQVLSLLGTTMSGFALTIWAYQITGEATALALVGFFSFAPGILMSPIAGALVDRWNRKLVMMISDVAAGVSTVAVLILYATDSLQIWHLFITGAFTAAFQAFQWPAYSAAISTMIPKSHYTRASGMMSLAESIAGIAAPAIAGLLLVAVGIGGVLAVDIVTCLIAVAAIWLVHIPQPEQSKEGAANQGSILKESLFGFRYIWARKPLLGLQLTFFFINLTSTLAMILLAPMILARTNNNELIFGSVQSAAGVGGLIGGILLSTWGGPKRRVHGVLLGMVASSLLGQALMGIGQSLPIWLMASFFISFFVPVLNGSNQAIWQAKVPPDIQGRVFSVRRLIAQITAPLAMLMAGPLADQIFEPAMMPGGALANTFGGLVGTGQGAGMALIFVLTGIAGTLVGLGGYLFPAIRNAEDILPDHDSSHVPAPETLPQDLPLDTAPAEA